MGAGRGVERGRVLFFLCISVLYNLSGLSRQRATLSGSSNVPVNSAGEFI